MATHTVVEGDWMGSIAADAGFKEWRWIWALGQNAGLKSLRQEPNLLAPGDRVYVPAVEPKTTSHPTDAAHEFVRDQDEDKLILRFNGVASLHQEFRRDRLHGDGQRQSENGQHLRRERSGRSAVAHFNQGGHARNRRSHGYSYGGRTPADRPIGRHAGPVEQPGILRWPGGQLGRAVDQAGRYRLSGVLQAQSGRSHRAGDAGQDEDNLWMLKRG